jgi:hypothetical protein
MRKALVLVVAAACGDDGNTNTQDAGVDAPVIDAHVEEPSVDGTWMDTYITSNGAVMESGCTTAPAVLSVDATTAAPTPYPGTCKPDGSFKILAPANLGTFYLRVQGALYETTKRAGIDLSSDHLGRNDVAAITGVTLGFNMTGMDAWETGDVLMAFSSNIGFYQALSFTSGGPGIGNTALTGTAGWLGYKIDSAKSDTFQVMQLGTHTTGGGLSYVSLDRAFDAPAFTMTNNTTSSISGAFGAPPGGTLQLSVNVASFNQFETAANPGVTSKTIAGSAYAAASTDVIPSPSLISFARDATGVTTLTFGTLAYGDPFPGTWQRLVKVQQAFQVPYTWNSVNGSMNATLTRVMPKSVAEAGIIDATLGPPTAPKLDGADAFTANSISQVPMVSWSAPTLGTPTDYEVQVYEVSVNGTSLKFVSTLRLVTKQTSVRIPSGYLLGQRQYVFVIRARIRQAVDVYTTPLRAGTSSATAETLTALVTTDG